MKSTTLNRRELLAAAAGLALTPATGLTAKTSMRRRPIPVSGEMLPVIGLGTYNVFDVESTQDAIAERKAIVEILTDAGGSVVDSSPMYNRAERVVGDVMESGVPREELFIATKVWTDGRESGIRQMRDSAELMHADVIDLMQVHNLRDTAVHMATIREWQEEGRIRYSGLTHYRAGAFDDLEAQMEAYKPDFIQINYSLGEREADQRILPAAADAGIAVLINRPYQAGALFRTVRNRELPGWALEFAESWGQFFLKFIISHPAVTCVIPATSNPRHMRDNVGAGFGRMPEPATRQRMVQFFKNL